MPLLRALSFPDGEFMAVHCGGVVAVLNGRERPVKYEPASQTAKHFGLINPPAELVAAVAGAGTLNGDHLYTYVEVDSTAGAGFGLRSGPPVDSEGTAAAPAAQGVDLTFPAAAENPEADRRWVYRSAAGGAWPVLGRIADLPVATLAWHDNGGAADLINFPLDATRDMPPAKPYAFKMRRRLIMWGEEPWDTDLILTNGSPYAHYYDGDELDESAIGATVYPLTDNQGYVIEDLDTDTSPAMITFDRNYVGTSGTKQCYIGFMRGRLAWSEPDDYENFPLANVRYVEQAGGDTPTGGAYVNGIGMIFTLGKTFGLKFDLTPAVGWGRVIEISNAIGCLSNRTIQDIGGTLLWLSKGGIVASAGGQPRVISDDVAPFFSSILKEDEGRVRRAFAVNWARERRYICFTPVGTDSVGCTRAVVVDYRVIPNEPQFRFTVYVFHKEMTAGSVERASDGNEYIALGDKDGYVWLYGLNEADGVESGTAVGTVDAATDSPATFTDNDASFDASGLGLSGIMVTVRRASDGTEQTKLISSNTGTQATLAEDWDWVPEEGDTYWIGEISAFYETGWTALGASDRVKKIHALYPVFRIEEGGRLTLSVYKDMSDSPLEMASEGRLVDLTESSGRAKMRVSGARGHHFKFRVGNREPFQPWKLREMMLNLEYDQPHG